MPAPPLIPWRSIWLPRAVTAVALLVGLPLFLREPPWCDITLYQMAARNLLHGGVHYRDLFDTNLPGFVWAVTALTWAFGPSVPVIRAVDLVVVTGVVLLIDRLAKWGGATPATRWWTIAAAAMFYPFTVEMAHAQRDTWMALPGLAAVVLRVRRGVLSEPNPSAPFRASFLEGLLWGAAVWVKPHIVLMALAVWLLTARRLAGEYPRRWRAAGADLLGNLLGGLAAGLPGVLWLVASGAWRAFLDVFQVWNPNYMKLAAHEFHMRVPQELQWFPPWSLGLVLTVPLALLSVLDMAPWSSRGREAARPGAGWLGRWLPRHLWDKTAGADARFARGVLGGLYLVWAAQAFFVQRGFQYAHVPETLLMFGLWAAHRWAWAALGLLWLAVTSGLWLAAEGSPDVRDWLDARPDQVRERYFPRHLITDTARLRLWPECWRPDLTDAERYALWDKLRLHPPHEASIDWGELAEVAAFLRAREAADGAPLRGRVVAWFDSPHAVYLMLDLDPGFRFMHVYTAIAIWVGKDPTGEEGRRLVLGEFAETMGDRYQRYPIYVVSDLQWVALSAGDNEQARQAFLGPAHAPANNHWLPTVVPYPKEFPWNQPTVFRTRGGAGRYVVHRLVSPGDSPDRPKPEE